MTTNHFSPEALTYEIRKLALHKKRVMDIIGKPAEQVLKDCTVFCLSPTRARWVLVGDFLEAYMKDFGANALVDKRFVDLCIKLPTPKFETMVTAEGNLGSGCRIGTVFAAYEQALAILLRTPSLSMRHGTEVADLFDVARCSLYKIPLKSIKPKSGPWMVHLVYSLFKERCKAARL